MVPALPQRHCPQVATFLTVPRLRPITAYATKPPLSRLTRFLLMGFIALCMVFTSGVAALKVYPGLALLPVVNNVKTSPYCPVWRSVTDAQVKIIQLDYEKKILAQSHMVRKEGPISCGPLRRANIGFPIPVMRS